MRATRRSLNASVLGGAIAGLAVPRIGQAQDRTGITRETIKVGVLGSLSGVQSLFGTGNLIGAQLVFDAANAAGGVHGRRIEIVSVDDESNPARSIAGFRRLVGSERVFAVMGPSASAIAPAVEPAMREATVPCFITIYSSPAATEPFKRNVFRTGSLNDRLQGRGLADFILGHMGGRRIALLRQSDEYGRRAGASMADRLRERGTPLAGEEVFNLTDTDFTSQLLRIRGLQPDVVAIYGFPAPAAILTRQARQLGITAQIIGSNTTSNRTYASTVGPAAEGVLNVVTLDSLPEGDEPRMAAFRERFAARHPDLARQNRPDLADCLGYGGAMAFLEGLRRAGPDLSQQGFIAALETLENFETGVTLPTTFGPERHEGNLQARVVQFQADLSRRLLDVRITAEG